MFFRKMMKMRMERGLTLMTLGGMIRLVMRKIYLMQIGLSVRKGNKIGMKEVKERVMKLMMRGVTVALISIGLFMMMMVMTTMTIPRWVGVIY
jgi:hypothetical protein